MAEFDLTAEIAAVLKEYTGDVMDKVDKAVKVCGEGMLKEIMVKSPKRTFQYALGWRSKTTSFSRGNRSVKAFNETNYQLTHLLERGHEKRGGKGDVRAYAHIGPAEEKWTQKFEQMCEEACKGK